MRDEAHVPRGRVNEDGLSDFLWLDDTSLLAVAPENDLQCGIDRRAGLGRARVLAVLELRLGFFAGHDFNAYGQLLDACGHGNFLQRLDHVAPHTVQLLTYAKSILRRSASSRKE